VEILKTDLTEFIGNYLNENPTEEKPANMSHAEFVEVQVDQIANPWMLYFIKLDPQTALEKVKCPTLALNGSKDLQVPPKENLETIESALKAAGNKEYKIKELTDLNHLFQECETGLPSEYSVIEQTFSPIALEEMLKWINSQIK
jgi:fermentation-respiration switch protein FrsA (DUF1100 family)